MRILYINTLYYPDVGGGAELILKSQAEGMVEMGHDVGVITLGATPGIAQEVINGVKIWRVGISNVYFHHGGVKPSAPKRLLWHALDSFNARLNGFLKGLAMSFSPDVISVHNLAGFSVAALESFKGILAPLILTLHDQYFSCVRSNMFCGTLCKSRCLTCSVMRIPHKSFSNRLDAVVGVSSFILKKMTDMGYFSRVKTRHVIRNSVSSSNIDVDLSVRSGLGVCFGYIGGLTESKGVYELLKSFSAVSGSEFRLLLAGKGDSAQISSWKSEFDDSRVEFIGYASPSKFYRMVDCVITPSLWEDTFPGVVLEALASGKPVIGSCRGGIPELVRDGQNGFLFDPGEDGALRKRILLIAEDIAVWRSRSEFIRTTVRDHVDFQAWLSSWEEFYSYTIRVKI
jgi:glycosyltransferase involved in cell wall biosynthesis